MSQNVYIINCIFDNDIVTAKPYNHLTNPKNFLNLNFRVFHHEIPIIVNSKRHFLIGKIVLSYILTVQNITKFYILHSGAYGQKYDVTPYTVQAIDLKRY